MEFCWVLCLGMLPPICPPSSQQSPPMAVQSDVCVSPSVKGTFVRGRPSACEPSARKAVLLLGELATWSWSIALWLGGYLTSLKGEENISAISKDGKVEVSVQCHIQNFWLVRRKWEETGIRWCTRISIKLWGQQAVMKEASVLAGDLLVGFLEDWSWVSCM